MTIACDNQQCERDAQWRVYASYNADHGENVHPLHARYPMPMIRACDEHVASQMRSDYSMGDLFSTRQYIIVPIVAPEGRETAPGAPQSDEEASDG